MCTTKNSLSSPSSRRVRTVHVARLLLLLFLVIASSTTTTTCRGLSSSSSAASPTTTMTTVETASFSRNDIHSSHSTSHDQRHHHSRPCDSFSHEKSRSLCDHLRRMNRHKNHRPPPPPPPEVIDPRYGVEKRLVPSGPNPLHN